MGTRDLEKRKIYYKEIINKVFKKAGISNKLDGYEDNLFVYPEELYNFIEKKINDENKED